MNPVSLFQAGFLDTSADAKNLLNRLSADHHGLSVRRTFPMRQHPKDDCCFLIDLPFSELAHFWNWFSFPACADEIEWVALDVQWGGFKRLCAWYGENLPADGAYYPLEKQWPFPARFCLVPTVVDVQAGTKDEVADDDETAIETLRIWIRFKEISNASVSVAIDEVWLKEPFGNRIGVGAFLAFMPDGRYSLSANPAQDGQPKCLITESDRPALLEAPAEVVPAPRP